MNQPLDETRLRQELARPFLNLGFSGDLEEEFRGSLRADRQVARTLFYLFPAMLFGLAPLYGPALLHTPTALIPLFRALEFGFLVPLSLMAAFVDYFRVSRGFSAVIHTLAIAAMWSAVILLRRVSVEVGFYFPPTILGIFMISAAVLCGYRFRRMLFGIVLFTGLGFINEITRGAVVPESVLWMDALLELLLAVLAIAGTWFNDALYRRLWLQNQLVALGARTDQLTGLTTRAEFNQRFAQLFAQARREHKGIAVMLLDVDRFKQINDRHGHLYGDQVLRAVGQAVSDTAARRPLDIAARYGGEELVVVWYDMPAEAIAAAAGRVLDRIRGIRLPVSRDSEPPPVSASAGIAHLAPDGQRSPEEVLHIADMLMYNAKRDGRDRFCVQVFEPTAAAG